MGSPHFLVDHETFFCPTLEIERRGDHLDISVDHNELDRFLAHVLR